MSKNKPENSENVQLTPVEFSPTPNKDAIGSVGGFAPIREIQYPLSLPVGIMLLTLIFSTVRDIATFNKGTANIERADAPSEEILKSASNLTDRIEMFRVALQKLSITDPVSAQIYKEYFPPEKKDATDSQAGAASGK
jgi:hypothetical protein